MNGFHIFFIITMSIGYGIAIYGKWLEQHDKEERRKERDKNKKQKEQKKTGKSSTKNGGGKTPKRYYIQHRIYMNTRR